ncbi:t-SNARE [Limtongia smithiae]|uniref:t-SNARE n=1 Tax=Limtongia smithiae TaxID=1125753 RepID=UPI0034CF8EDE
MAEEQREHLVTIPRNVQYRNAGPSPYETGYANARDPFEDASAYEMNNLHGADPATDFGVFMDEISNMHGRIRVLQDSMAAVSNMRLRLLNMTQPDEMRKAQDEVDGLAAHVSAEANYLKDEVRRFKKTCKRSDAERQTHIQSVQDELMTALRDYQGDEGSFRGRLKDITRRQILIVMPNASEDEMSEALEYGNQQIFQTAIARTNRSGQAQSALGNAQGRLAELHRIQQSMMELNELMTELAEAVEQQEEQVEGIVYDTYMAKEEVATGKTHLQKAVHHAKNSRKLQFVIVAIIIVIIVLIAWGIYKAVHN